MKQCLGIFETFRNVDGMKTSAQKFCRLIIILLAICFLIPFPKVVADGCVIVVTDATGAAIPEIKIVRSEPVFLFDSPKSGKEMMTDQAGHARFPNERRWVSAAKWLASNVWMMLSVHSGVNTSSPYVVRLPEGCTAEVRGPVSATVSEYAKAVFFRITGSNSTEANPVSIVIKKNDRATY